mmetsp:Transcript_11544/g.27785  ORF Transcript_11544/g.27785 Transcript_11544/m.27785 type:complete len:97 (+) Transcript_11544:16-306(+)
MEIMDIISSRQQPKSTSTSTQMNYCEREMKRNDIICNIYVNNGLGYHSESNDVIHALQVRTYPFCIQQLHTCLFLVAPDLDNFSNNNCINNQNHRR